MKVPQIWIAVLRIIVGAWFLKAVWTKLTVEFAWGVVPYLAVSPRFIAFQRVESRYVLKREPWRLIFAEGRFVRDERPGLEIAERVDAVLEDDTLYVVSWPKAHSVLDLSM